MTPVIPVGSAPVPTSSQRHESRRILGRFPSALALLALLGLALFPYAAALAQGPGADESPGPKPKPIAKSLKTSPKTPKPPSKASEKKLKAEGKASPSGEKTPKPSKAEEASKEKTPSTAEEEPAKAEDEGRSKGETPSTADQKRPAEEGQQATPGAEAEKGQEAKGAENEASSAATEPSGLFGKFDFSFFGGTQAKETTTSPTLTDQEREEFWKKLAETREAGGAGGEKNNKLIPVNLREANIDQIVKFISDNTHKPVILQSKIQGIVNIVAPQPLPVPEALDLIYQALLLQGVVVVETKDRILIVQSDKAQNLVIPLDNGEPAGSSSQMYMKIIPLQYNDAGELAKGLGSVLGPGSAVTPVTRTNSLLVKATRGQIANLEELLKKLDAPETENMVLRVYYLKHVDANTVSRMIQDVAKTFQSSSSASTGGSSSGSDKESKKEVKLPDNIPAEVRQRIEERMREASRGGGPAPSFTTRSSLTALSVYPDPQANRIVVAAPAERIPFLEDLIEKIDQERPDKVSVHRLEVSGGNIQSLSNLIEQVWRQLAPSRADSEMVRAIPHPDSNSILVLCTDEKFQDIQALADTLQTTEGELQMQIFYLKNADANQISPILQNIVRSGVLPKPAAEKKPEGQGDEPSQGSGLAEFLRGRQQSSGQPSDFADFLRRRMEEARGGGGGGDQGRSDRERGRDQSSRGQSDQGRSDQGRSDQGRSDQGRSDRERSGPPSPGDFFRSLSERMGRSSGGGGGASGGGAAQPTVLVEPRLNALIVIAPAGDVESVRAILEQLDVEQPKDLAVRRVVLSKDIARDASNVLLRMFGGGRAASPRDQVEVQALSDNRTLLILSNQQKFDQMQEVIHEIDGEQASLVMNFITPQTADAATLGNYLDDVFRRLNPTQEVVEFIPTPDRSRLLVLSRAETFEKVKALAEQLDTPEEVLTVRVFDLQYADASQLLPVVQNVLRSGAVLSAPTGQGDEKSPKPDAGQSSKDSLKAFLSKMSKGSKAEPPKSDSGQSSSDRLREYLSRMGQGAGAPSFGKGDRPSDFADYLRKRLEGGAEGKGSQSKSFLQSMLSRVGSRPSGGSPSQEASALADTRTNSLIVLATPSDLENVEALLKELDVEKPGGASVHRVLLRQSSAREVSDALMRIFRRVSGSTPKDVIDATAGPDDHTLFILANEQNFEQMLGVIDQIDGEQPNLALHFYDPVSVDASRLGNTLDELFRKLNPTAEIIEFIPSPDGTRLMVLCSDETYKQVEELAVELDTPAERMELRVYPLQYADANQVSGLVDRILRSGDFSLPGEEPESRPEGEEAPASRETGPPEEERPGEPSAKEARPPVRETPKPAPKETPSAHATPKASPPAETPGVESPKAKPSADDRATSPSARSEKPSLPSSVAPRSARPAIKPVAQRPGAWMASRVVDAEPGEPPDAPSADEGEDVSQGAESSPPPSRRDRESRTSSSDSSRGSSRSDRSPSYSSGSSRSESSRRSSTPSGSSLSGSLRSGSSYSGMSDADRTRLRDRYSGTSGSSSSSSRDRESSRGSSSSYRPSGSSAYSSRGGGYQPSGSSAYSSRGGSSYRPLPPSAGRSSSSGSPSLFDSLRSRFSQYTGGGAPSGPPPSGGESRSSFYDQLRGGYGGPSPFSGSSSDYRRDLMSRMLGGGGPSPSYRGGGGPSAATSGVTIVPDPRLNALVVIGYPEDLDRVGQVLTLIDTPQPMGLAVRAIELQNGNANNLVNSIYRLFQNINRNGSAQDMIQLAATPDDRTLLVLATEANFDRVKEVVDILDVRRDLTLHTIPVHFQDIDSLASSVSLIYAAVRKNTEQVNIVAHPDGKSLLVLASDENFKTVEDLIKQLDIGQSATLEIIQIQYGNASDLSDLIQSALAAGYTSPEGVSARKTSGGSSRSGRTGQAGGGPMIYPDTVSNALIVVGTPEQIELVKGLVKQMDTERPADVTIRYLILQHVDAGDTANALSRAFQRIPGQSPRDQVEITSMRDGRGLVVLSSEANFKKIEELVKQIDNIGEVKLRTVQIKYKDPQTFADMLTQVYQTMAKNPEPVTITTSLDGRSLLVVASDDNFKIVEGLIKDLDNEENITMRTFELKFAQATDLATLIQSALEAGYTTETGGAARATTTGGTSSSSYSRSGRSGYRNSQGQWISTPSATGQTGVMIYPEERTNTLVVVGTPEQIEVVADLVAKMDVEVPLDLQIRTIELTYASARDVATALGRVFDRLPIETDRDRVEIQYTQDDRRLVIMSSQDNFKRIQDILKELDTKEKAELTVIKLKYADATDLAAALSNMINASKGSTTGRSTTGRTTSATGQSYTVYGTGGGEGLLSTTSNVTIIAETRINAILVTATPEDLAQIQKMVETLDRAREEQLTMHVMKLEYGDATTIAQAASSFFQPASKSPRDQISVVSSSIDNSIMIYCSDENWAPIEKFVKDMDTEDATHRGTKTYDLKYVSASQLADELQQLYETGAYGQQTFDYFSFFTGRRPTTTTQRYGFVPSPVGNKLMVVVPPQEIPVIDQLVEQLDSPEAMEGVKPRVYYIMHTDATQMSDIMTQLFQSGAISGQRTSTGSYYLYRAGSQTSASPQQSILGQVNFVVDRDANALIAFSSNPANLDIVDELVKELDTNAPEFSNTELIQLEYADALDMSILLNAIYGGAQPRGGTTSTSSRTSTGGTTSSNQSDQGGPTSSLTPSRTAAERPGYEDLYFWWQSTNERSDPTARPISTLIEQVRVVPDIRTNMLVVTAAQHHLDALRQIIAHLDRPEPQVLIKAQLVEIVHDNEKRVGLRWTPDPSSIPPEEKENAIIALEQLNLLSLNHTTPSIPGQTNTTQLVQPSPAGYQGTLTRNFAQGAQNVLSTNINLGLLMQLLLKNTNSEVLSNPMLTVDNNQTGTIFVGSDVPYITNSQTNAQGFLTNSFDYTEVGTRLDITPHINRTQQVVLEIDLTAQKIREGETVLGGFIFDRRTYSTQIALDDGQTIVLGGIMGHETDETERKTPILGDIPLIKTLFRKTDKVKTTTELVAFVTPNVMWNRDEADQSTHGVIKSGELTEDFAPTVAGPTEAQKADQVARDQKLEEVTKTEGQLRERAWRSLLEKRQLEAQGLDPYAPKTLNIPKPSPASESAVKPAPASEPLVKPGTAPAPKPSSSATEPLVKPSSSAIEPLVKPSAAATEPLVKPGSVWVPKPSPGATVEKTPPSSPSRPSSGWGAASSPAKTIESAPARKPETEPAPPGATIHLHN
ncbi:MAG: hypothetical protein NTW86_11345 [Candidatus Sumerlaeota bacterium]|nr:hypothetical protein [Candidatus Sumerlaeota bacterium]